MARISQVAVAYLTALFLIAMAPGAAAHPTYPYGDHTISGRAFHCELEEVSVGGTTKYLVELVDFRGDIDGQQDSHDLVQFTFDSLDEFSCIFHPIHVTGVSIAGTGSGTASG